MKFAFALFTFASSTTIPSWLTLEAREKLTAAIEERDLVVSLARNELNSIDHIVIHEDVLDVLMHIRVPIPESKYMGISTTQNSDTVWTSLGAPCSALGKLFWFDRPHWFAASIEDIVMMRMCTEGIIQALEYMSIPPTGADEWSGIVIAAAEIMRPVYSRKTELKMRNRQAIEFPQDFMMFQTYVRSSAVLMDLLTRASATVPAPTPDAFGALLLEGGSEGSLRHAGDYIDKMWGDAASQLSGGDYVPYWKALVERVENFDELEFYFDLNKPGIRDDVLWRRFTHYRAGMGLARSAWRSTVGSLIGYMQSENSEATNSCFPSQISDPFDLAELYSHLETHIEEVITVYKCLVEKIVDGSVVIAGGDSFADNIGVLMHMTRMSTNTLAYLMTH